MRLKIATQTATGGSAALVMSPSRPSNPVAGRSDPEVHDDVHPAPERVVDPLARVRRDQQDPVEALQPLK